MFLHDPEPTPPAEGFDTPESYPFVAPGAKANVLKAISERSISSASKVVQEFKCKLRTFFGVPVAKACSSGYAALILVLQLGDIGPGDDVLVPTFTMVAAANTVFAVRANLVAVDCAKGKLDPSVAEYEKCITPATKALIVAHNYMEFRQMAHSYSHFAERMIWFLSKILRKQ